MDVHEKREWLEQFVYISDLRMNDGSYYYSWMPKHRVMSTIDAHGRSGEEALSNIIDDIKRRLYEECCHR